MTCVAQARHGAGPEDLYEGYWVLMFAVAPGCPACEDAIAWLGQAADSHREICVLNPWWKFWDPCRCDTETEYTGIPCEPGQPFPEFAPTPKGPKGPPARRPM